MPQKSSFGRKPVTIGVCAAFRLAVKCFEFDIIPMRAKGVAFNVKTKKLENLSKVMMGMRDNNAVTTS